MIGRHNRNLECACVREIPMKDGSVLDVYALQVVDHCVFDTKKGAIMSVTERANTRMYSLQRKSLSSRVCKHPRIGDREERG